MDARELLSKLKKVVKGKPKEKYDWKEELKDWIVSFVTVAIIYFLILPAILGTSSPLVIVSSCSEKGFLNIGDIVIVKGVKAEDVKAPLVNAPHYTGFTPVFEGEKFVGINISGEVIKPNESNDIIVYYANPSGSQIIHRVLARINTSNWILLVTKGDANPVPDQLGIVNGKLVECVSENLGCISTHVNEKMVVGKKIGPAIPLLGHLKLFFCDVMPFCQGHSNAGTGYEYKLWC